jgi:hypothetical protein
LRKIVVQNGTKSWGNLTLVREAPHPDSVTYQEVVERAVQGSKKDTSIRAIVSVVDSGGRVIKSLVAPRIVAGEHRIAAQHVALLRTIKGLLATDLAAQNSHRYKPRGLSFSNELRQFFD